MDNISHLTHLYTFSDRLLTVPLSSTMWSAPDSPDWHCHCQGRDVVSYFLSAFTRLAGLAILMPDGILFLFRGSNIPRLCRWDIPGGCISNSVRVQWYIEAKISDMNNSRVIRMPALSWSFEMSRAQVQFKINFKSFTQFTRQCGQCGCWRPTRRSFFSLLLSTSSFIRSSNISGTPRVSGDTPT